MSDLKDFLENKTERKIHVRDRRLPDSSGNLSDKSVEAMRKEFERMKTIQNTVIIFPEEAPNAK